MEVSNHIPAFTEIARIELVTMPRYLNMSFNPVNFYYCYAAAEADGADTSETLLQIVVEINNTFGESHLYYPRPSEFASAPLKYRFGSAVNGDKYLWLASQNKDFHVSPFNSLDGAYDFCFSDTRKCFDVRINLLSNRAEPSLETKPQSAEYMLMTRLWSTAQPQPLTAMRVLTMVAAFPIANLLTTPRILLEAGKLHFRHKLKVYAKPLPPRDNTTKVPPPSALQERAMKWVIDMLGQLPCGHFVLTLPNGSTTTIDNTSAPTNGPVPSNLFATNYEDPVHLAINNHEFFTKLYVLHGRHAGLSARALALANMTDDFTCDDMASFLALVCDLTACTSTPQLPADPTSWGYIDINQVPRIHPTHCGLLQINDGSEDSDQFACQLTSDTIESLYITPSFANIVAKLELTAEHTLLQLECGNGAFTWYAASICHHVTIITLSLATYTAMACEIDSRGLSQKVSIIHVDNLATWQPATNDQQYNAIVSLEEDNSKDVSSFILDHSTKILAPNGRLLVQTITGPYHPYQKRDLKPLVEPTLHQRYQHSLLSLDKIWILFTDFTHNPFGLEQRYLSLLQSLGVKGYINGHMYAPPAPEQAITIPNLANDIVEMVAKEHGYLSLVEMGNIGDHYPPLLNYWRDSILSNHDKLIHDIQENAIKRGCVLKLNEADITEVHRIIQFHISYLTACFKSVWSVSSIVLQKVDPQHHNHH
eukprot:gene10870-12664_t